VKVASAGGTPTTLAADQVYPQGIAVDGTSVYWTTYGDGTVVKLPASGGTPFTVASGQNGPNSIAVSATSVYWTNYDDGTVARLTPK
jgi:hypothetical protein